MLKSVSSLQCNKGFYDFSVFSSGSPRRQELLAQLGVTFERMLRALRSSVSRRRARSSMLCAGARESTGGCRANGAGSPGAGADTIVILNGEVLEKPRDADMRRRCCANYRVRPIR